MLHKLYIRCFINSTMSDLYNRSKWKFQCFNLLECRMGSRLTWSTGSIGCAGMFPSASPTMACSSTKKLRPDPKFLIYLSYRWLPFSRPWSLPSLGKPHFRFAIVHAYCSIEIFIWPRCYLSSPTALQLCRRLSSIPQQQRSEGFSNNTLNSTDCIPRDFFGGLWRLSVAPVRKARSNYLNMGLSCCPFQHSTKLQNKYTARKKWISGLILLTDFKDFVV